MLTGLEVLLKELEGLDVWGVKISAGGLTCEIGPPRVEPRGFRTGQFTLWLQTRARLYKRSNVIWETSYPLESENGVWQSNLAEHRILEVHLNNDNNALSIRLDSELALIVIPGSSESRNSWMVFDNRIKGDGATAIVYQDDIER